jgi:hypothetical protein
MMSGAKGTTEVVTTVAVAAAAAAALLAMAMPHLTRLEMVLMVFVPAGWWMRPMP